MANRGKPSAALLKDLQAVYKKHNWSGREIGIEPANVVGAADLDCPPGRKLKSVTFKTASGKWVTELRCVDDDD